MEVGISGSVGSELSSVCISYQVFFFFFFWGGRGGLQLFFPNVLAAS